MIPVPMLRRRPGRRPDRRAGRRRPRDQGDVDGSGLRQPHRHHLLLGDRPPARPDADGRVRLPAVLGQRVRRAHPDTGFHPSGRRARVGGQGGQPQPAVRLRVHLEDHLRRRRGQLPGRIAGQHRLVPAIRGEEVDRPGQDQPAAPPAIPARCRRGTPAYAAAPADAGAEIRAGARDLGAAAGRRQDRLVDRAQRRLLHQPRRAARHGTPDRRPGQGRRHRGHRGGGVLPVPERPGRHEHPDRAHLPAAARPAQRGRRTGNLRAVGGSERCARLRVRTG